MQNLKGNALRNTEVDLIPQEVWPKDVLVEGYSAFSPPPDMEQKLRKGKRLESLTENLILEKSIDSQTLPL